MVRGSLASGALPALGGKNGTILPIVKSQNPVTSHHNNFNLQLHSVLLTQTGRSAASYDSTYLTSPTSTPSPVPIPSLPPTTNTTSQTPDVSAPGVNESRYKSANGHRTYNTPRNMASNGSDKPTNGANGNTDAAAAASNGTRNEPRPGDYVQWKSLPPGGPLNRWSHTITREHDFPGAQVSSPSLR